MPPVESRSKVFFMSPGAIQVTAAAPAHGAPVPACRAERAAEAAHAPSEARKRLRMQNIQSFYDRTLAVFVKK